MLKGEVLKGEMLKGEVLKAEPRRMLTRPGRLRAQSGSKLPTANVPLQALEGWVEEKMYFLLGCVRCASGKYDLNDREGDFRNVFGLLLEFTLSLCLFWSACLCQTDQPRSQSRPKKAKEKLCKNQIWHDIFMENSNKYEK